ncbi:HTH-type transcriptional repressor CsiR [Pigmentiphaga humi]|uniref:HTH-type transcriptional repressor CsiR n=1 Tax=Pigmentiphaga humi TaxID=2478468 RepID=A0A3P4B425_9BURK|nr:GntR family transcriptional regulator [Pigmentiphaga humi]VCU71039.1 HTH-type transcriptional repressor CsiR [Pigmentiphaga humi]
MTSRPITYASAPSAEEQKERPQSEMAYVALRRRILLGQLPPGERLKIEVLQKDFSLSSTPLREALTRLTAEGLVVSVENRGFRTAPLNVADLRDITHLRAVLEADALTDSIARGDAVWESSIVAAHHRLEQQERRIAEGQGGRDEDWTVLHKAFHMALLSACSYPRVIAMCENLFDQSERYRRFAARVETGARDVPGEHAAMMEAALARDVDRARHMLIGHLMRTGDGVAKKLDARNPAPRRGRGMFGAQLAPQDMGQ